MTHQELCARALRWLSGTRRCKPVFANIASCTEIPDAIGWSSCYKFDGSTVIECKTSRTDFYKDDKKRFGWKHPVHGYVVSSRRWSEKEALAAGYERIARPQMGDFRFYLCEWNMLTPSLIEQHTPDHGLLYVKGRSIHIIREAPRRLTVNYPAEVKYLRFAILNSKEPHDQNGK